MLMLYTLCIIVTYLLFGYITWILFTTSFLADREREYDRIQEFTLELITLWIHNFEAVFFFAELIPLLRSTPQLICMVSSSINQKRHHYLKCTNHQVKPQIVSSGSACPALLRKILAVIFSYQIRAWIFNSNQSVSESGLFVQLDYLAQVKTTTKLYVNISRTVYNHRHVG